MSTEVLLAAGYAGLLVTGAFVLEWLSAHTHRRSLRYRTAGFTYDETQDHWECPEGEHLWPHEFDHERRLVRYRAKAHICNGCPRKAACTDSDRGREIVRPAGPLAAFRSRPLPPHHLAAHGRARRADPRRRSGAPPRAA